MVHILAETVKTQNKDYFNVIMPFDERRKVVWEEITKFIQRFVSENDVVLDLGAGYCYFINNIVCGEKYALDLRQVVSRLANGDVKTFVGNCLELDTIVVEKKFDIIFASHLLEHLTREDVVKLLKKISLKLKNGGKLILLQPNYRYCYREYFDDWTHVTPMDHISLRQVLELNGFNVTYLKPRFLPYSMDSKLPTLRWLVSLYLKMPFKPFAKQMFCVAQKID